MNIDPDDLKKKILDTSMCETRMSVQGKMQLKSSISNLNLSILPNYHAKDDGKSIIIYLFLIAMNSMMLAKY